MHAAWSRTRFRVAPGMAAGAVCWPRRFAIVSAYATTGQIWTAKHNAAADRRLELELRGRGGWLLRLISELDEHREPAWAADISRNEGRRLGALFHRDVIYCVAGDELVVTACRPGAPVVVVGSFRERLGG